MTDLHKLTFKIAALTAVASAALVGCGKKRRRRRLLQHPLLPLRRPHPSR